MPTVQVTLQWAGPGRFYKTPNPSKIVKKYYFDEFRRVPGKLSKIVKKSKIDDFGGTPENPRKIVLGSLKIVKNHQNIVFLATEILFFDNNIVAASGRSQKRGGGLRPPPLFWTILLSKNSISAVKKIIFS